MTGVQTCALPICSSIYTASAETSLPKIIFNSAFPLLGPLVAYSPSEAGSGLMVLAKKDLTELDYRVALWNKPATDQDPGSLKYLTEPGVVDAVWSPDGSQIAYVQSGELWIMDSATGGKKFRVAATGIQSPCWSKK